MEIFGKSPEVPLSASFIMCILPRIAVCRKYRRVRCMQPLINEGPENKSHLGVVSRRAGVLRALIQHSRTLYGVGNG